MKLTIEEKEARKAQRIEVKKLAAKAAKIESEKSQKPVKKILFTIEWRKSRTWGNCPHLTAEITFKDGSWARFQTSASGYGYDKASTVIGECFNAFLKYKLWALPYERFANSRPTSVKEPLPYGIHAYSVDSRTYGQGIGVNCYYDIAKAIGGEFKDIANGKTFDVYEYNDLSE
jgi:hypothetical protein